MSEIKIDLRDPTLSAEAVRNALSMNLLPEGGSFLEIWREKPAIGRGVASTILFLLAAEERAHWHRIDTTEVWLWHAGAPLQLNTADPNSTKQTRILGPDIGKGETLQVVIPPLIWQEAKSLGRWTIVANVATPAFDFKGLEVAPVGWEP